MIMINDMVESAGRIRGFIEGILGIEQGEIGGLRAKGEQGDLWQKGICPHGKTACGK